MFGEVVGDVFEALGEDCGMYLDRVSMGVLSASILIALSHLSNGSVRVFVHRWHDWRS